VTHVDACRGSSVTGVAAPENDVLALTRLVHSGWVTMCLRAMVELGLPDAMAAPEDLPTLAERTSTDPAALARLLRVLGDVDLVERDGEGLFRLTEMGRLLRSGHPSGMRSMPLMLTWLPSVSAWSMLADAIRTGAGVFAAVNGSSSWEIMSRDPEQAATFNAAMARRGTMQADAIRDAVDLAGIGCVVDVGGGTGALLEALLAHQSGLRAVLADRPHVAAEAEQRMAAAGVADRCEIVAADFFAEVPTGGDAYVLSNILHDWPDDDCLRILGVVHAAMAPGARLWVLERVLDPDPPRSALQQADVHLLDLHMLVMFGAQERTVAEYDALLTAAGFDHPVVHTPSSMFNVVESTRLS
jgi:hypothetical protein